PGVAALVGQHLAGAGPGERAGGGAAVEVADAPAGDFDGPLARGGRVGLLAQHLLGEVPADGDDRGGPGDAGAAPQAARPGAVLVAPAGGVDLDDPPVALGAGLPVDAEAGRADEVEPGRGEAIEHGARRGAGALY